MAKTLSPSTSLNIGGISIHQDENGRFSLNDLHQAAGGEDRHKPFRFVRSSVFKALAEAIRAEIPTIEQDGCLEIKQTPDLVSGPSADCSKNERTPDLVFGIDRPEPVQIVNGGTNPGTYVARELVYAYAMWISPAFNLRVIRTFDDLMMGRIQQAHEEAQRAIEASERRAELTHIPAKEKAGYIEAGFKTLCLLKQESNPERQQFLYSGLKLYYQTIGEPLPPIERLLPSEPQIAYTPSDRFDLLERIEALERVRDILVSAMHGLIAASERLLMPTPSDGMPEPLGAAIRAIKLANSQKGGAA
jgi:hypothetical protein